MNAPRLIVNADDYGLTPAVSAGIRVAHADGIVTSTSVLAVAPSALTDLREALRTCPQLGIGVHLSLTGGWRPLEPRRRVPSLVTWLGRLPSGADAAAVLARARPEEVHREWRAQIEAVIGTGAAPDHLDAHHDIAYRSLALTEVLLALATEFGLPLRLPASAATATCRKLVADSGVPFPRHLRIGPAQRTSWSDLFSLLDGVRPGTVVELGCHPGRVDLQLRLRSSHTRVRERELALFTDARLKRWLAERGVELTTFSCLAPGWEPTPSAGTR